MSGLIHLISPSGPFGYHKARSRIIFVLAKLFELEYDAEISVKALMVNQRSLDSIITVFIIGLSNSADTLAKIVPRISVLFFTEMLENQHRP